MKIVEVVGRGFDEPRDAGNVIVRVVAERGVALEPIVEPAGRPRHAIARGLSGGLNADAARDEERREDALLLRIQQREPDHLVHERLLLLADIEIYIADGDAEPQVVQLEDRVVAGPLFLKVRGNVAFPSLIAFAANEEPEPRGPQVACVFLFADLRDARVILGEERVVAEDRDDGPEVEALRVVIERVRARVAEQIVDFGRWCRALGSGSLRFGGRILGGLCREAAGGKRA